MAPARTREAWVDVAKGVAILLVVLFHAGGFVPGTTAGGRAWEQVNVVLVSVRMPLFFLVSGLFVGKALATGSAGRFLRNKAWPPLYVFAVWLLIFAGLHLASVGAVGEPALDSLLMQTTLWYMAALAIHMTAAWVLRGVPPAVQIGGAALLAAPFAVWLPFEWGGLAHIPNYLVFFLVGCYGRQALTGLVRGAGWRLAGVLAATCAGLLALAVVLLRFLPEPKELQAAVLFVLLPIAAVPLVLICCHVIVGRRAGRWLAWLGRHTLPVFLLHPLALQLLDLLGASAAAEQPWPAWILPPLLTVGALTVSVLGWHLLEMHAPWLFGPTRQRFGRHSTARAARSLPDPTPDAGTVAGPDPYPATPSAEPSTPAFGIPSARTAPHRPPSPTPRRSAGQIPLPRRDTQSTGPSSVRRPRSGAPQDTRHAVRQR